MLGFRVQINVLWFGKCKIPWAFHDLILMLRLNTPSYVHNKMGAPILRHSSYWYRESFILTNTSFVFSILSTVKNRKNKKYNELFSLRRHKVFTWCSW